jgi:hypothetical protein
MSSIKPPTPYDQLLLARSYAVDHWVIPALTALCTKETPVTLKEAREMCIEDVVLVATVREDICNRMFLVGEADPDEVAGLIQLVQADMLSDTGGDNFSLPRVKSGSTTQEPSLAEGMTFGTSAEVGMCRKKAVSSTKGDEGHGSDEDVVCPCNFTHR